MIDLQVLLMQCKEYRRLIPSVCIPTDSPEQNARNLRIFQALSAALCLGASEHPEWSIDIIPLLRLRDDPKGAYMAGHEAKLAAEHIMVSVFAKLPATVPDSMPPRASTAIQQYQQGVEALRDTESNPTDRQVYEALANSHKLAGEDKLPTFPTWSRNLRTARNAISQQKHQSRAGRAAGKRSIVASQVR